LKNGVESVSNPAEAGRVKQEIMTWVGGIAFVDVVPKNPSGKILRKDLRVRAKEELERGEVVEVKAKL
jgi:acyl-coenzyme A synthetase/AMP-(fatty) acid ligase